MADMIAGDYDVIEPVTEHKMAKASSKDLKNKHKVEARRRIDDLMEQKRLRRMLDLDEEDELEMDFLN